MTHESIFKADTVVIISERVHTGLYRANDNTHIDDVFSSVFSLYGLNCEYIETAKQLAAFICPQLVPAI